LLRRGVDPQDTLRASDGFFDALRRADAQHAVDLAIGLVERGAPAERVLLDLVAPAQERVGRLWQSGQWSVAQEHAATCINEHVVAAVGAATRGRGDRGLVVLGCLDGEWHTLPARIVSEVLRLHGWRVTFLGPSVPSAHLIAYLHEHGPDIVAVSCALPIHLPTAHQTIAAARRTGTPVLAGGPGFGAGGRWAHRLGVDAWAGSATEAVELLGRQPWPPPRPAPAVPGAVEYAALRERRGELVAAGVPHLLAGYVDADRAAEAEDDVTHVVDFLAAAVYLGECDLFGEFLTWSVAVLRARDTPVTGLAAMLADLRTRLHDFPVARSCLDLGRTIR